MTNLRNLAYTLVAAALLSALVLSVPTASASYLFNATLSLKGNCDTTAPDKVPDPPVANCPAGEHPPAGPFFRSQGIAVDFYGNIYVSSYGTETGGTGGHVDVFDPEGFFISELSIPNGPQNIAVDTQGNLYVRENPSIVNPPRKLTRYTPTVYEPEAGNIEYSPTPTLVVGKSEPFGLPDVSGIAINPENNHLYLHYENRVVEFNSAEDGNEVVDTTIGFGTLQGGKWVAVDAARNRIYATDSNATSSISRIRVFDLEAPHALLETINGSSVPGGKFGTPQGHALVAVDEANGHLLVGDMGQKRVLEFDEEYAYLSTTNEPTLVSAEHSQLYIDNGPTSPNQGYFFITSGFNSLSNAFAFEPLIDPKPPVVESLGVGQISETDAELRATINPESAATTYTFEYTTFADESFANATIAGEGQLPAGNEGVEVSAGASNLSPASAYRFRVKALNAEGEDVEVATFTTYPEVGDLGPCPANEALRTGPSALLPDCRAYELVTPADTGGRIPSGAGGIGGPFPSYTTEPLGNVASFLIDGGALPGFEGTGAFNGQNYTSSRGPDGWVTEVAGPNGSESQSASPGGISPDQGYTFWGTGGGADEGTKRVDGLKTNLIRYPDGNSELIGRGSLDTDPQAIGKLITEDALHIVFQTQSTADQDAQQLEPNAPPEGTEAVYDRTRDPVSGAETTHVVSLLPGDVTPAAGQSALYTGASEDGEGIAFKIGTTLYLRVNNEETFQIGTGVAFAGVAAGGSRIFYVEGGDLLAFDTSEEKVIDFTETGDATVVNVASEGTRAYFVSPSVLGGENPLGDVAQPGEQNLYLSEEGTISFVGTVTDRDVEGEKTTSAGFFDGLGLWVGNVVVGWPSAHDPSRATPDGSALLFASRADLTGFESGGQAQIYRYDHSEDRLHCLSCNPTGTAPDSGASLQTFPDPLTQDNLLRNLIPSGNRAFFQSSEPLVAADTDGLQDVYEWEEEGLGTCKVEGGCLYLISYGQSARDDFLFGVSESGNDVFFTTADQLLPRDTEPTVSIYDARVGGGFPETGGGICVGEACHAPLTSPPGLPTPASEATGPSGNAKAPKRCPKGKRKVKRHGKVVCVKKKKQKKHSNKKRAGASRGTSR